MIEQNVSLKSYNTFHLDVNASYFIPVAEVEDLKKVFDTSKFRSMKRMILGEGSNVLFTRSFLGLVLKMNILGIRIEDERDNSVLVSAGAGENWHQLVLWAVERGLGGIENLALIPGTVGAAPMQNIGAYGVEIKEVFHSLEAYEIDTGKVIRFYREDCKFNYRYSIFKGPLRNKFVITRVFVRLNKQPELNTSYDALSKWLETRGDEELSLKSVCQAVIDIRQSKLPDPAVIGNAGSFFKNPVIEAPFYDALRAAFRDIPGYEIDRQYTKVPAAWLIEKSGWKGKRIGDVGVHHKQALVLVNYGGGTGKEILALSEEIRESVSKKFGIHLEPEVNIVD